MTARPTRSRRITTRCAERPNNSSADPCAERVCSAAQTAAPVMATRARTQIFCKYRESLKTHRKVSRRRALELKEFKPQNTLLAQPNSDDETSLVDARVYSVPPVWVTLVDDLNRDIASIERKGAQRVPPGGAGPTASLSPALTCAATPARSWRAADAVGQAPAARVRGGGGSGSRRRACPIRPPRA